MLKNFLLIYLNYNTDFRSTKSAGENVVKHGLDWQVCDAIVDGVT